MEKNILKILKIILLSLFIFSSNIECVKIKRSSDEDLEKDISEEIRRSSSIK